MTLKQRSYFASRLHVKAKDKASRARHFTGCAVRAIADCRIDLAKQYAGIAWNFATSALHDIERAESMYY